MTWEPTIEQSRAAADRWLAADEAGKERPLTCYERRNVRFAAARAALLAGVGEHIDRLDAENVELAKQLDACRGWLREAEAARDALRSDLRAERDARAVERDHLAARAEALADALSATRSTPPGESSRQGRRP